MIHFEHWGLIDYQEAWDRQRDYVKEIQQGNRSHTLVFCQHPTVVTAGRATEAKNLLVDPKSLGVFGVQYVENNRGGDLTVHNPGQLVGYPIFDLSKMNPDLHWFLRNIEEAIIQTIANYGLKGHRVEGQTGVWIDNTRKVCAIGINCSRWVCSHGFALNVANDLNDFQYIVPCGISDKEVTSISKEVGNTIAIEDVENICKTVFFNLF